MANLQPVGARMIVADLTAAEVELLGWPAGTTGAAKVGVVMAVGDAVELEVSPGDRVYHTCNGPKCGSESQVVGADCVLAIEKKEQEA